MSDLDDRLINTGGDRAQAVTLCVRAFFRSMHTEEFSRAIEESRISGQETLVESLYSAGVIANIVKAILGRIDKGHYITDQIDDYIQDATVVLIQIAGQGRLDLTKSAGEIASYICLWIEQRVKRLARKDQRWRFSLYNPPVGIDNTAHDGIEGLELNYQTADHSTNITITVENNNTDALPEYSSKAGIEGIGGYNLKRSERNILSIFGSTPSDEKY